MKATNWDSNISSIINKIEKQCHETKKSFGRSFRTFWGAIERGTLKQTAYDKNFSILVSGINTVLSDFEKIHNISTLRDNLIYLNEGCEPDAQLELLNGFSFTHDNKDIIYSARSFLKELSYILDICKQAKSKIYIAQRLSKREKCPPFQ